MHRYVFKCHEQGCGFTRGLESPDIDITTSSGCCPTCGGEHWNIYNDKGECVG